MSKVWLLAIALVLIVAVATFVVKHISGADRAIWYPYRLKKYFFTKSEQEFFNILNAVLDAHRYTVFPKVRLGDFIEVAYSERRNRTWWNKIRSKHVDYLIWDLVEKKIALAIELDGNSHRSQRAQESDSFKDKLYQSVNLELMRIRVGSDFRTACQTIREKLS